MGKTSIEWTATIGADGSVTPGASWNPIRAQRLDTGKVGWHCERVSAGCQNCYSAAMNHRNLPGAGTGLDYVRSSRDKVEIFLDKKTLLQPLKWKKPRKVFVCSMTDLFAEFVPFEMIDRVFAVMATCSHHTFQVLTKRPDRMAEYMAEWFGNVLPNVWLGTSVEDQRWADERIPHLIRCPAAVRFLSCEPLLGHVDLSRWIPCEQYMPDKWRMHTKFGGPWEPLVDWGIIGGESGPKSRAMDIEWMRSLTQQCQAAGVPVFNKQLGRQIRMSFDEWLDLSGGDCDSNYVLDAPHAPYGTLRLRDNKGGDMAEFPPDLRIRQFPQMATRSSLVSVSVVDDTSVTTIQPQ